jgi:hypothetical protein
MGTSLKQTLLDIIFPALGHLYQASSIAPDVLLYVYHGQSQFNERLNLMSRQMAAQEPVLLLQQLVSAHKFYDSGLLSIYRLTGISKEL